MTQGRYQLFGWHLSYFSGKARCYLVQKRIPFDDRDVSLFTLTHHIRRRFGTAVMPVLLTPEGEWVQDTAAIIDLLEQRFPSHSIWPKTPVLRLAAAIMEMWGDEWWIPVAMHTRWRYPENYALFEQDAGRALLPWAPGFLQRKAVAHIADMLRGYLEFVGAAPDQGPLLERWTYAMLDLLEAHFRAHPFLFGSQASIGDFGLVGPMYGHLGRDPWPKREMIAPRPALRSWIDRMAGTPAEGACHADDRLPETLEPIFRIIFREFIPLLQGLLAEVERAAPRYANGRRLPRRLGMIEYPMLDDTGRRGAIPFTLWKAQRVQQVFAAMTAEDQAKARDWAQSLGGEALLDLRIPRLERRGVYVALAQG